MGSMDAAVRTMKEDLARRFPGIVEAYFGHIADSNLHLIATREGIDAALKQAVEQVIYGHAARFGGAISAEHGVGRAKRAYLPLSRSAPELALMRTIKAALDPAGILNPGRVLDAMVVPER